MTLCHDAAQWDWEVLPEQLPPAPHHSEQAMRQLQAGPIPNFPHMVVTNCLKCGFWLLETSQPENGAAAVEVREKHQGLAQKQPTLGGGIIPQEEQSGENSSQFGWKMHPCFSIVLLTLCWDMNENLPTAQWISEASKPVTVRNAEVEALTWLGN